MSFEKIAVVLYGEEVAKVVQLLMEYDPAPPFDVGSPEKAGPELVQKAMFFVEEHLGLAVWRYALRSKPVTF